MNEMMIIGNVTRDPELKTTQQGVSVCSFTVAVNKPHAKDKKPDADFIRVTAWRGLAETCARYLSKGRKVAVIGSASASAYVNKEGNAVANLEISANNVEFLTPKNEQKQSGSGYFDIVKDDNGELHWE